jgi:hypothetical protein
MTTFIAFSGSPGDSIYVEEDIATVRAALAAGASQYAALTQVPSHGEAFAKGEILLNVARIAYVREA